MQTLKETPTGTRLAMLEAFLKDTNTLITLPTRTSHPEGQTFAKVSYIMVGMRKETYNPDDISTQVKRIATAFKPLFAEPAIMDGDRLAIGIIKLEENMDGITGMFHESGAQPRGMITIFFYPSEAEARFAYSLKKIPDEPVFARLPVERRR